MYVSYSALQCTSTQINIKISHVVEVSVTSSEHKMESVK